MTDPLLNSFQERFGQQPLEGSFAEPPKVTTEDATEFARAVGKQQGKDGFEMWGGFAELPKQVLGGFIDAANSIGELLGESTRRQLQTIERFSGEDFEAGQSPSEQFTTPAIPVPAESTAFSGKVARVLSQFIAGFAPASHAVKAVGLTGTAMREFLRSTAAGAMSDLAVMGNHEDNLSNLLETVPGLRNPITEFLAIDEDDPEMTMRMKNALEGAALGAAVEPLLASLRIMKSMRKVKSAADVADDAAAAKPLTPEEKAVEPEVAGNIRVDKYDTVEEAKEQIRLAAKEREGFLEARGVTPEGTVPDELIRDVADMLAMDPEQLVKKTEGALKMTRGELTATMHANRQALAESAERVFVLKEAAKSGAPADLVALDEAWSRHLVLQEAVSGLSAEAGRFLRIHREMARAPAQAKARLIDDLIQQRGGMENMNDLVTALDHIDSVGAMSELGKEYVKREPARMLTEFYINWLLSGPQTQVVNALSNTLTQMFSIPEDVLAAGLGKLRPGSKDKVFLTEALGRGFGMFTGALDGLRLAAKAFRTEVPQGGLSKLENMRFQQIPSGTIPGTKGKAKKTLSIFGNDVGIPLTGEIEIGGRQIRLPGRFLMAGDEFFKATARHQELTGLAIRDALNEGVTNPLEIAKRARQVRKAPTTKQAQAADDFADYMTFTRRLGSTGKAFEKILDNHPTARFIVPFLRTPLNIVKFAGARTPIGRYMPSVRAEIQKGGASRDRALARMIMGSSIAGGVMTMAANKNEAGLPIITGHGPADATERERLYNQGWLPYSIDIGTMQGKKPQYMQYSRVEPLGILFGMSADASDIWGQMDKKEALKVAELITIATANNFTNKTFLKGISDTVEAYTQPTRYGEQWVKNMVGSFLVPTGAAQVARFQDPIFRDVNSITDAVRSRTPGYSQFLPARTNLWGEPILDAERLGPDLIYTDLFSPLKSSAPERDTVESEMIKLEYFPRPPKRKINGVELEPEEYAAYKIAAGRPAKQGLDRIVQSPIWRVLPKSKKRAFMEKVVLGFRRIARQRVIDSDRTRFVLEPEREELMEDIESLMQLDVPPQDFVDRFSNARP